MATEKPYLSKNQKSRTGSLDLLALVTECSSALKTTPADRKADRVSRLAHSAAKTSEANLRTTGQVLYGNVKLSVVTGHTTQWHQPVFTPEELCI